MAQITYLFWAVVATSLGAVLGYYARQSIAKRNWKTIEAKLQKKTEKAQKEAEKIVSEAREKAESLLEKSRREGDERRRELYRTEKVLLKRENVLEKRISEFESREEEFKEKVEKLKTLKANLERLEKEAGEKLEKVASLSREEAKKELFANIEKEYQKDILGRIRKLEMEGSERFERKAKEILTTVIQKYAPSQAQEITTTTVSLPSDELKGKIIGREGRNIRTLERLTGVELIVDDTPETLVISGFDPIRRQTAKVALEKLIADGRIQPAKIEEKVKEAKEEISAQIKKAGETAVYELGLVGIDPKLVQLLGRLKFRTSYGQNVLLHSIEVALLASALAEEVGADPLVCKEAGLFHDIGKAVDWQVEGSHVEIGMKILEKFRVDKKVIDAMKSHHGDYPAESLEAVLVQVADQISGARPGARKDTLENYLKRLSDLEDIATSFPGVEKAWALQAGREIRVFVRPEEVDDYGATKLAKEIADRVQEELRYPGEIKVTVIREKRIVEYAK